MTERTLREQIAYLCDCAENHADKFPVPQHMRDLVASIRAAIVHTAAQPAPAGMPEARVSLVARTIRQSLRDYGHKCADTSLPECIAAAVEQALSAVDGAQPAPDAVAEADPAGVAAATEVIQWQGKEITACAMIQHIATTLKEKGKGLITTDPASFGQTILEFDAALTALGKKAKP